MPIFIGSSLSHRKTFPRSCQRLNADKTGSKTSSKTGFSAELLNLWPLLFGLKRRTFTARLKYSSFLLKVDDKKELILFH